MTNQSVAKLSKLKTTHTATLDELGRYKLLVDNVEDYAIFLLDKDGYIQTWNKGAKKNKGYAANEIIGKHFSIFYLPVDVEAKKPERELDLATRLGRVEDEDWRVRKDGTQFWANVVITALREEDGTLVGFAKVTRDLTDRKNNEDILRNNNVQLKQQQVELEALNESKDEFISLASHQLRTPATAIKQMLGMLTQGFVANVDPELMPFLQKAYEANERQIRLVDNLLNVARLDAGKVVLRKKTVVLKNYLSDILEEYSASAASHNQTLHLKLEKNTPANALLDADYLRMAINNLLDNAIKYSNANTEICLQARRDSNRLCISVVDQGVGIHPDDQNKLFEKFSRIPNELSEKVSGSGLGLYWVKRVIEMHGGKMSVTSEAGNGSTFTIELPIEDSDA